MSDRFFDLHIHLQMQKIVGDRLRPADKKDPHGVEDARTRMATALGMVEQEMASRHWAMGDTFTHGRLRGRAGAVLCRQGRAVGGTIRTSRPISNA